MAIEQYDLYDGTPPHQKTTTSLLAAVQIKRSAASLRERVFRLVAESGVFGKTDDEIEAMTGMRHQTASARRRELVLLNRIVDSTRTRKTRSGRNATVWVQS